MKHKNSHIPWARVLSLLLTGMLPAYAASDLRPDGSETASSQPLDTEQDQDGDILGPQETTVPGESGQPTTDADPDANTKRHMTLLVSFIDKDGERVTLDRESQWHLSFPWMKSRTQGPATSAPILPPQDSVYQPVGYMVLNAGEDPYQIATAEQLALLSNQVNATTHYSKNSVLTRDIDLSAHYWVPIGKAAMSAGSITVGQSSNTYFGGEFDGKGHVISGLKIGTLPASYGPTPRPDPPWSSPTAPSRTASPRP